MRAAQMPAGLCEGEQALINRQLGVCEAQRAIEDTCVED
jgi:hypothetical protein